MDCQVLQGLGVTLEQGDHLVLRGQGDLQDLQVSTKENCTIVGVVYPHEFHCIRMISVCTGSTLLATLCAGSLRQWLRVTPAPSLLLAKDDI